MHVTDRYSHRRTTNNIIRFGKKTKELQDEMYSGHVTIIPRGTVQQWSKQSGSNNERYYSKIPYLKRDRVVIEFPRVRYYLVTWFLHPESSLDTSRSIILSIQSESTNIVIC